MYYTYDTVWKNKEKKNTPIAISSHLLKFDRWQILSDAVLPATHSESWVDLVPGFIAHSQKTQTRGRMGVVVGRARGVGVPCANSSRQICWKEEMWSETPPQRIWLIRVVLHHDYDCTVKSVEVQCVCQTADSRSCDFIEGDVILWGTDKTTAR